jgi:hypothetical protein
MPTTPKLGLPYPLNTDPADVPTDMFELADRIDDIAAVASGLATLDATGKVPNAQIAGISLYTPVWGAYGTAPVLGNGNLVGRYVRIGAFVYVSVSLTAGSTTTFGTSGYTFTPPFGATGTLVAMALAYDSSTGLIYWGASRLSGTVIDVSTLATPAEFWGATIPFSWASNDQLHLNLSYPTSVA